MKSRKVLIGIAVLMVVMVLAGYGGGNKAVPVDGLEAYLAKRKVTTAEKPATVKLARTNITDNWGAVNRAVRSAGIYIVLDLSDCFAMNDTVEGAGGGLSSPSGNDMNIIQSNEFIKGIILPKTLKTIGDYAFDDCSALTSVVIPPSVTSIGVAAFRCCSGLTSIAIPASITVIEALAFADCKGLTAVTIPDKVTAIRSGAFQGSGLTSVTIPASVKELSSGGVTGFFNVDGPFAGCEGLRSVTFAAAGVKIGSNVFPPGYEDSVSIGDGLEMSREFSGSDALKEVYVKGGAGTYTYAGGKWSYRP